MFEIHIKTSYADIWGEFHTSWSSYSVAAGNSLAILSLILVIVQVVKFPLILYAHDIHRLRNESDDSASTDTNQKRTGYIDFDASMESPVGRVI